MAKKYDKKKTTVDKTGKDGVSFGDNVPDSYAECYPSMQYEVRNYSNNFWKIPKLIFKDWRRHKRFRWRSRRHQNGPGQVG